MENLPLFKYDALSARQIRLLRPDVTDSSGLSWSLSTADVDDPSLQFTALSYAWLTHTHPDSFPISCNGGQLDVHHNLYTALPFLARRCSTPFWIDAVCINQADDGEKTSQIRLMNTIYRHAVTVIVWLGVASKPEVQALIPRAIELLPLVASESARSRQPGPGARLTPDFVVDRELAYLGREGWEALLHLLRNPYFRRVWMVQEVALAREIVFLCGDHEIEWHTMEQVVADTSHLIRWTVYDLTTGMPMRIETEFHDDSIVFAIRDMITYDGDEGNAHQTIRIANLLDNQACSTPQDRVLGILGMVQLEFGSVSEDLHTYISIPDLYTRFSTLLFEASGLTDVHWWYYMSMAFRKNRIAGLPSWVPDLHHNAANDRRSFFDNMMTVWGYSDPPWRASSKPRKAAHGPRRGEIILHGKIVDEIAVVYPEVPCGWPSHADAPDTAGMKWLRAAVELIKWEQALSTAVLTGTPESPPISADTYWRTLIADFTAVIGTSTHLTLSSWLHFQAESHRFLRLAPTLRRIEHETSTDPWVHPSPLSTQDLAIVRSFRDPTHPMACFMVKITFTKDHALFCTKAGRFGFTCTGVQRGDVVGVFDGSVSPFVLRQAEGVGEGLGEGDRRWRLVGDAYVGGLMYGEADEGEGEGENILLV